MNKKDIAQANFQRGFNCSQSVIAAFSEDFDLDQELALRVAAGFGGGMGRRGDTCGAVSGALMVIGLKYGAIDPQDKATKEHAYELVRVFIDLFKERNEVIRCNDLLGVDMSTPEGHTLAKSEGRTEQRCPKFVGDATEILMELL